MSTAELIDDIGADEDVGRLANNYMTVQSLQKALSTSETNVNLVPRLILRIARDEAWRAFLPQDRPVVRWNAADFRKFVESDRRDGGCQTPIHVLRHMVKGSEAEEIVEELLRGERGGANNPTGKNQWAGVNRNNVTVDQNEPDEPDTIPIPQSRVRDYTRESKQGHSVSYAIRRLGKNRPELLERVKSGELTPHRAMVEAGFRPEMFTAPKESGAAARAILRHFQGEELRSLLVQVASHAGYTLMNEDGEVIEV